MALAAEMCAIQVQEKKGILKIHMEFLKKNKALLLKMALRSETAIVATCHVVQ